MIAEVRAVCPKGVKKDDLFEFKIKKQVMLPIFSLTDADSQQLFVQGGKVIGKPVLASIKEAKTGKVKTYEGILVEEKDGGCYVIPKEFIEAKDITPIKDTIKTATDLIKETGLVVEETAKATVEEVKEVDTQKYLGFSKKQLLVMAVLVLVTVKIFK